MYYKRAKSTGKNKEVRENYQKEEQNVKHKIKLQKKKYYKKDDTRLCQKGREKS